ncbi:MAG: ATP-binding protein [Ilumatobacteraceae bacterium]
MSALRFSAVVGQEQAKTALLMGAVNPRLGGVLLRGDKGSAKTTLARGLAALLPNDAPFVELPLGATEDRVIGSLDVAALLTNGEPRFRPGLLAAAHGGVLYVDEINLLADHLVDALLDASVSGVNHVQRDGISHSHPARFVLVASMNPEEGELRPQLLDRFGLAVDVTAPTHPRDRIEAVRRQLALEQARPDAEQFRLHDLHLRERLLAAQTADADLPAEVAEIASHLALEVGAEGLRADLMLCRAATANAALDGRDVVTADDVRAVAEMVLAHRRRRRPFDEPGIPPAEMDKAWNQALDASRADDDDRSDAPSPETVDQHDRADTELSLRLTDTNRPSRSNASSGRFGTDIAPRGRIIREIPLDAASGHSIDGRATATALATRRAVTGDPSAAPIADDLRSAQREQRTGALVVLVVDASGSMGVEHRMAATKAATLGLLADAYRRRGRVALVTFRGSSAEVVLRPTASIEIAKARLQDIRTGGTSPLAAGLDAARDLVSGTTGDHALHPTIVIVTDGRATHSGASGEPDAVQAASEAGYRLAATGARIIFVDTETGHTRLGHVAHLAEQIHADYVSLDQAEPMALERTVRSLANQ